MRTRRRLAGAALVVAAALAAVGFAFRHTWWGDLLLATGEAGVVGGLADWFAVTALFRHPLGLPIPHTALIPANWEMLASRVGTMVGRQVLTREYLAGRIGQVDVADAIARAAAWVGRNRVETTARSVLEWVARQLPVKAAGDLVTRLQALLIEQPAAPALAAALELARQHGWDDRVVAEVARGLARVLDRPEAQRVAGELVDELLARYRARMPLHSRIALTLADLFGVVDRDRLVASLRTGLQDVAADPAHPVRRQLVEGMGRIAGRLRTDAALIETVEAVKQEILGSPLAARLVEEALDAARHALLADLERRDSDVVAWVVDRVDRWRRVLAEDPELRAEIDRWVKERVLELVERFHGHISGFIEKGVHELGPEGAVRLVEEHAGDDLQFIRVNGTVVGALAGAALFALQRLLSALTG